MAVEDFVRSDMRAVCLCLLLVFPALAGEVRIFTFTSDGTLKADGPAVLRQDGYALAPRETLYGAARAIVQDGEGRLHPLLWVTGEDVDAGVVEVWVGGQAPAGPDVSSFASDRVRMAGQAARLIKPKESGAFGMISRLEAETGEEAGSGPLYDEHGLLAGWHALRTVDGQRMSFAVPVERLNALSQRLRWSLEEWNARHDAGKEEPYVRAIGYLWADEFDGALFYFRKSAEVAPANARVWLHLGFVEGKSGHAARRVECYRKAIELDPMLVEAHYLLGFSLLMRGDHDGAYQELRILRKLDAGYARRLEVFMKSVHVDVMEPGGRLRHRTPRTL